MLTKSNYLWGLQCSKFLWILKNDKARIPEPDQSTLARFKEGKLMGILATRVFPGGIDLSELDFNENIEKTKESLKLRKPMFEAGFLADDLFSRADILLPVGQDEWDIIEVKGSTRIKDINIHDISFQKYVYEKAGLKIRNCILMHVNNEYVKSGEIEPRELFIQADITEKVSEFSEGISNRINQMFKIIEGPEPEFNVEDILTIEYENIAKDEFMDSLPDGNIFELYRMYKKKCIELYKNGCIMMTDIPEDVKLNDKQKIQKSLAENGGKHIDKQAIQNFINNLEYPLYYLDFETVYPAIPRFDKSKPYQQIPFQFSLHIQENPNIKPKHISFLAEGSSDPRPKFMQALKDNLKDKGSILVYNQRFEKSVMKECSDVFPEFKEWYEENILPRIKDLLDVFKDFSYYDPRQKGSASIKKVLPLFSKNLAHKDLEISEGQTASLEYERITYDNNVSEEERERVRKALEEYCALDTLAEVEILNGLRKVCKISTEQNNLK